MLHLSEICLRVLRLFDQADFIVRNITVSSQLLKQTIKIYITEFYQITIYFQRSVNVLKKKLRV